MKNRLLTTTIIIVILSLLTVVFFFFSPSSYLSNISLFKGLTNNTSLIVKTRNSKLEVKIDDKEYGETPLELDDLKPGKHTLQLTRVSTQEDVFYEPATVLVEVANNTEAVVDIEIGPAGSYSGYILTYSDSPYGRNKSYLTIGANTGAQTQLDEQSFGRTPTSITEIEEGEHTLLISAEGYEDLEIPIQGSNGYNLNVTAYLYPIPITLETIEQETTQEN